MMYRHQIGLTEKLNERNLDQTITQQKNRNKFTSLAPYIAEIQRRKKMKSLNKRSKKNLNESSSKSFRIKEKSVTLLQKDILNKTREQTSNYNLPIKKIQDKINKQRRTRSVQKHHEIQISKTIDNKNPSGSKINNNFFNDLYARVKSKIDKDRPLRRNKFETLQQRTKSQKPGQLNIYKISYTNIASVNVEKPKKQPESQESKKPQEQPKKKTNFRKNKYEILQSSVGELQQTHPEKQQTISDGKIYLDKKQSNSAINIQMDKIAQRQMQSFYQQVITKQMHRSIQKSTQKYFSFQSYRPTKSKNQIQVYVSTVANPSLNKVSKSTNEKSDYKKQTHFLNQNSCLDYDFDFKNQEQNLQEMINEDNPSQEQSSVHMKCSMGQFQKQRKQVEIQFFNKPSPDLEWSEDQCKIDQL